MKKTIIPFLLLVIGASCQNQVSQTNFDRVRAEHPTCRIFSEQPLNNSTEWIVREDDKLYIVEIDQNNVPKTTVLIERWNPNWNVAQPTNADSAELSGNDSIRKFNDTANH